MIGHALELFALLRSNRQRSRTTFLLITLKTTPMVMNTTTRKTSVVDSEKKPSGWGKKAT